MLTWDKPTERYYHHGLDRGVLYPSKLPPQEVDLTNDAITPYASTPSGSPGWYHYAGGGGVATLTYNAGGGYAGRAYYRMAFTTAPTTTGSPRIVTPRFAVVPGEIISMGIYGAQTDLVASSLYYEFLDAAGAVITPVNIGTGSGPAYTPLSSGYRRYLAENVTVPAGSAFVRFAYRLNTFTGATVGGLVYATAATLNRGPVAQPYYYDGDSPDTPLYRYEWEGAVNASRSLRKPIIGTAVPWNGLQSFDEGSDGGAASMLFRDGVAYLADVDPSDFVGKLTAISFPDEFYECMGMPQVADGLFADNQKPKRFDMSYRTLVGNGGENDRFGYQIHLVYKCMASPGSRQRKTLGDDNKPVEFPFDIVCTPVKLPGYRPTAHYIIDTRYMSPTDVAQLEGILYGDETQAPRMPTPTELYDLMNFGNAIVVTSHSNGTFTVEGSNSNIVMTDKDHFQLNNINATVPNTAGQYTISDGGTTTVVVG